MKRFLIVERIGDETYVYTESDDVYTILESRKWPEGGRRGGTKRSLEDLKDNCELNEGEYVAVDLDHLNNPKEINMKKVVLDAAEIPVVRTCDIDEGDATKCYAYKNSKGMIVTLAYDRGTYNWIYLSHGNTNGIITDRCTSVNSVRGSISSALSSGYTVNQFEDWRELFKWTLSQTSADDA